MININNVQCLKCSKYVVPVELGVADFTVEVFLLVETLPVSL